MRRAAVLLLLGAPVAARADGWGLDLAATADAPLLFGMRATVETPGRGRLAAGGGWVPGAWVRQAEEVALQVDDAEGRPEDDASLALWRVRGGWSPFRRAGLYLEGGYARASFSGDLPVSLVEDAIEVPAGVDPDARLAVASTLHLAEAEIGWEAPLGRAALVRVGVAYLFTLRADVDAALPEAADARVATALDPVLTGVEAQLAGLLEDRVRLPLLSLALGIRL